MTKTHHISARMSAGDWGVLLALSVLWGGSFFFVEVTVGHLPTLTVVVARVGLAALILNAFLIMRRTPLPRSGGIWMAFFGMGLLNNAVPFTLLVWGQQQIASGLAAILNATTPLFTVLVAHALTSDEKLTPSRLGGVVLGFAGVVTMMADGPGTWDWASLAPQLACLGAALSYAAAGIFGRRFQRMGIPPITTAAGQVTASSLLLAPVMLWIDRPWTLPVPGWEVAAALLGLAALSTALAYILYFRLLGRAGATNMSLVTFLVPVSAILLGILVLNEVLSARQMAGMVLIGLGLAAIDGRVLSRLRVVRQG